ncbi:hypothetical protein ACVIGB_000268 [Bradyrhizobium sp. USDA 4341]
MLRQSGPPVRGSIAVDDTIVQFYRYWLTLGSIQMHWLNLLRSPLR